nr:RHS repeat-associated core domain-containing protein [Streptomyces sp. ISL-36]
MDSDEYGNPRAGQPAVRYHWLGAKQRSSETLLVLMGVRLYNPQTGRFLSADPVYGGNADACAYPGDPVNQYDLVGRFGWGKFLDRVGRVASVGAMFRCGPCAAVDAAISIGRGTYKVRHGDCSGWIDIEPFPTSPGGAADAGYPRAVVAG